MRQRGRRMAAVGLGVALAATLGGPPATAAVTRVKIKDDLFKPKDK